MSLSASSVEEARVLGDDLEELYVNKTWDTPWQEVARSHPNLRRLRLCRRGGWDVGPLDDLPPTLTHVEVHNFGDDDELWAQLAAGLEALPDFESLSIGGAHSLFIDVGRLQSLKSLRLRRVLGTLPASLAQCQQLEHLDIAQMQFDRFPEVICELTHLTSLVYRNPVRDLPDAFANLQLLQTLNFRGAFNNGTRSVYKDEAKTKRLPDVLGRLSSLTELNLGRCGVFESDLERLAGLQNLKRLRLNYASISDLSVLSHLGNLRSLDLETCYNVRSLRSLQNSGIEELSLRSNHDLKTLDGLETLHRVKRLDVAHTGLHADEVCRFEHIEELVADPDVEAQWRRHRILKGVSQDTISAGLQKLDDHGAVDLALVQLSAWCQQHTNGSRSSLYAFFNVERRPTGFTEIPTLQAALNCEGVTSDTLATFIESTLRSSFDSLSAIRDATNLLIERRDLLAQQRVGDAFHASLRYHDAGQLLEGPSLHRSFYEELLPRLLPDAIAAFVCKLDDALLANDGLDGLFAPALHGASPAAKEGLVNRLHTYLAKIPSSTAQALLARLKEVDDEVADSAQTELDKADRLFELKMRVEDADDEELLDILDEHAAGDIHNDVLRGATNELVPLLDGLDLDGCRRAFDTSLHIDAPKWRTASLWTTLLDADDDWLSTICREHETTLLPEVERWLQNAQKNAQKGSVDDETLAKGVRLQAALSGRPVAELEVALVRDGFCAALDKNDPARILAAVNAFMKSPTTVTISNKQKIMLSSAYESLYMRQQWSVMAEISDKLLQLSPHLQWSEEARQYPLSYLVAAAIAQDDTNYLKTHLNPWLETGMVEPRLAFNVACFWAQQDEVDHMLDAVKQALALGKPADQFIDDDDFAPFLEHPDMRRLLGLSNEEAIEAAAIDVSTFPSYDLDAMVQTCTDAFAAFGAKHPDAAVCAMVIQDCGRIDFNVEAKRGAALNAYSHLCVCRLQDGFDDDDAFSFSMSGAFEQAHSAYAKAMAALLRALEERGAYGPVRRTSDFVAAFNSESA